MTLDEVYLQLRQMVFTYGHVAKRTEARSNAVYRLAVPCYLFVKIVTASLDALLGILAKFNLIVVVYYLAHLFDGEMLCTYLMNHIL